MSTVVSIIVALIVLSVFVVVHELGHFLVARALKFEIIGFDVGMGPRLVSRVKNGIEYTIRAFPIGGMCRFYGEDEDITDNVKTPFNKQAKWKRFLVTIAGPIMNIITALIFAMIALVAFGDIMPTIDSYSSENTVAEEMGLEAGDIICAINGKTISYYSEASELISASDSDEIKIAVERDGERLTFTGYNIYDETEQRNILGVYLTSARKTYGFFEAIGQSFNYVISIMNEMFKFLGSLFTQGISPDDVVGPVGTISIIGQAVRLGFETVLRLSVLISINLGIMNLLPFPALDGGRIVFIAIEAIRGKAISPEKEGLVHMIGFGLLMVLVVYLTFKDISALIGG